MQTSYTQKVRDFTESLETQGVKNAHKYAPAQIHGILRKLDIDMPPFIIAGFWQNTILFALIIVPICAVMKYFLDFIASSGDGSVRFVAFVIIQSFFAGIAAAFLLRLQRRKLEKEGVKFPKW